MKGGKVIQTLYHSPVCTIEVIERKNGMLRLRLIPTDPRHPENYAMSLSDVINESGLTFEEKQKIKSDLSI